VLLIIEVFVASVRPSFGFFLYCGWVKLFLLLAVFMYFSHGHDGCCWLVVVVAAVAGG
jgi:hypothetical protein